MADHRGQLLASLSLGERGVGTPKVEAESAGGKEPLDRGCDLQLREATDWFEPDSPGIQRGRQTTQTSL